MPWFFPLSTLLWVNLHGAWIFGLVLLAIYALAAHVESVREQNAFAAIRTVRRARAMAWAWIFSAFATLVNPYGWRLHAHIYRYLSDRYLMNRIAEFRSPDFHGWAQRCFGLILLLALVALASTAESSAQSSSGYPPFGVYGIDFFAESSSVIDAAGAGHWADALGTFCFARRSRAPGDGCVVCGPDRGLSRIAWARRN